MILIHYDNNDVKKGRLDNSGVRYYVTPTLRKYDLGLMTLGGMGMNGPLSFTVPPLADSLTFTSICYPECMVNIFGKVLLEKYI
jgi:dopamine beta-monooxygenase